MATLYWLLRIPLMLIASVLARVDLFLQTYVFRGLLALSRSIMTGPYYWLALRQRAAEGQPGWRPQDGALLGIPDPNEEPLEPVGLSGLDSFRPPELSECSNCNEIMFPPTNREMCLSCTQDDIDQWRQEMTEWRREVEQRGSHR